MMTREQAIENLGAEEVARRQEAERLWLAQRLAYDAYGRAFDARPQDEDADESDAHHDVAPLLAAFTAAEKLWMEFETNGDIILNFNNEPERCVLTNLIVFEEDEYLENDTCAKFILIAALGLEDCVLTALTSGETDAAANDDSEAA